MCDKKSFCVARSSRFMLLYIAAHHTGRLDMQISEYRTVVYTHDDPPFSMLLVCPVAGECGWGKWNALSLYLYVALPYVAGLRTS